MDDRPSPLNAIDEIYTNPERIIDFVKMQVAFWEKLVVLDAATLAASFTASGVFRDHFTGDGGVGYLTAAWKLLTWGLALCLLAQWFAISVAMTTSRQYYGMRVLSLLNESSADISAKASQYRSSASAIIAQTPKLRSQAEIYSRVAQVLGSAGLLASMTALYWLNRFARANVFRLGH